MRVRYGKPIKVKSLVGNQTSLLYNSQAESLSMLGVGNGFCLKQGSAYIRNIGAGVNVSLNSEHKYFILIQLKGSLANTSFNIYYANDDTQLSLDATQYRNLQDKAVCALLTNETKFRASHLYSYGSSFDTTSFADYYFIVDLTEIGLDTLTAQEFYNKYNKYFPLIATGEEITIDDKAGQISLGPKLPVEYQEVEYIESTGTQYIDTGYKLNDASNVEISFSFTNITRQSRVFGSQANGSTSYLAFSCYINGSGYIAFNLGYINGSSGISTYPSNVTAETNTIYNVLMNKNKISINDNIVITNINPASGFTYYNAQLFRCIGATDPMYDAYQLIGKIYSCKIYDNSILVRDFIPCYRKSDNEIGMYDLVNRVFYTNQGTGTFLKGNNVNNYISCNVTVKEYGYNQLCFPIQSNLTGSGTTWTETANGFLTTSSNTGGNRGSVKNIPIVSGHKYYIRATLTQSETGNCFVTIYNNNYSTKFGDKNIALTSNITDSFEYITTSNFTDASGIICFYMNQNHTVQAGDTLLSEYINVIDLTDWYGPGKEPTTVAAFKEKFTKEYYGYCPTPIKLTRYQIEALPSYGYNQLVKNGNFVDSSNWSVTENTQRRPSINNNIYTIETLTQGYAVSIEQSSNAQFLYSNHKYLVHFEGKGTSAGSTTHLQASIKLYSYANSATIFNQPYQDLTNEFKDFYSIITPTQTTSGTSASGGFRIYYQSNTGLSYVGDKVQMKNIYVIDLTDWYGAGNEPTTIEEFKATFPHKFYPYSKKTLLNRYMINSLGNN